MFGKLIREVVDSRESEKTYITTLEALESEERPLVCIHPKGFLTPRLEQERLVRIEFHFSRRGGVGIEFFDERHRFPPPTARLWPLDQDFEALVQVFNDVKNEFQALQKGERLPERPVWDAMRGR